MRYWLAEAIRISLLDAGRWPFELAGIPTQHRGTVENTARLLLKARGKCGRKRKWK